MRADRSEIEKTILSLTTARGEGRSICPSEVARAIAGNDEKVWRLLMHPVRETALALAREGRIVFSVPNTTDPALWVKDVFGGRRRLPTVRFEREGVQPSSINRLRRWLRRSHLEADTIVPVTHGSLREGLQQRFGPAGVRWLASGFLVRAREAR